MPNPLITLNDPATTPAQFEALLAPADKTFFVVLGDTAAHHTLAAAAQPYALNFRHVILVTNPAVLYPKFGAMSTADVPPPVPAIPAWFAIAISFDGRIVDVAIDAATATTNIIPFFLDAES